MQQPFFELSHAVRHGLSSYRGLPAPLVCDFLSREDSRAHYAAGTEFLIAKIEMVGNSGTYIDAPFHRYRDGVDIAGLALETLVDLPALVLDLPRGTRVLEARDLAGLELEGRALLVRTGWSRHYGTDQYFDGHPYLSRQAALALVERRVRLVGIDSLNIDDTRDATRPVHSALLGAGIPIVEHLTGLEALPRAGLCFSAVPPPICGMGSFPVRAYARLSRAAQPALD